MIACRLFGFSHAIEHAPIMDESRLLLNTAILVVDEEEFVD
jgi:hypothetical protein